MNSKYVLGILQDLPATSHRPQGIPRSPQRYPMDASSPLQGPLRHPEAVPGTPQHPLGIPQGPRRPPSDAQGTARAPRGPTVPQGLARPPAKASREFQLTFWKVPIQHRSEIFRKHT